MLCGMSATATKQDNELSRHYLAWTYIYMSQLLFSPPSLGLVQCLIGIAILIRTTPCGRDGSDGHFLSTSLRVAQSLAYNDDGSYVSGEDRDVEHERRVFWLGFINDTNGSILSNAPTTRRREDIVAPKPSEEIPADSLGAVIAAEGHWKVNVFSLRVNLALLQAEAIEQVLSRKALDMASMDIDAATTIIITRLQAFHDHEIFNLSPPQLFELLYRSDIAYTVSLEASYFATVYRLHAFLALDKNPRINPFALVGLRQMPAKVHHKSHPEARKLLSLLPIGPRGDIGIYWMHHQTLVTALMTVLAHHLHNPAEPAPTPDDLRGVNDLIADMGVLAEKSANVESTDIAECRELCVDMYTELKMCLP
jgi:hypothetical protein